MTSELSRRISSAKNPQRPKLPFDHAYMVTAQIDSIQTGVGGKPGSPTKGQPYIVWNLTVLTSNTAKVEPETEWCVVRYINNEYNEKEAKALMSAILGVKPHELSPEASDDLIADDGAVARGAVVRITYTAGTPKKDGTVYFDPTYTHVQLPEALRSNPEV